MNQIDLVQFQLDFSTVDMEKGSRLEPMATTITIVFPSLIFSGAAFVPITEIPGAIEQELEEGYRIMAGENSQLAELSLPIALETWPVWEA